MSGKLIVLEGIDGSGKATQAQLLIDSLSQLTQVTYFDFPRYEESLSGALVGRWLAGEFGPAMQVHPYFACLPLMIDRAAASAKIRAALAEGYVVCNRYTTSSMGHQTARLPEAERSAFLQFIDTVEHEELGIPRPDFVIYLSLTHETADAFVDTKNQRNYLKDQERDAAEKDRDHQAAATEMYLQLVKTRPQWSAVECMEHGQVLSPPEIHRRILDVVLPKLDAELLSCMVRK